MEESPETIRSSSSVQANSKSNQFQGSTDKCHFKIALDTEQGLSSYENTMGVKKELEQPQANVQIYRRLTPKESLEKIKADVLLKSTRLRFKSAKRLPYQQKDAQQVDIKNLEK